MSVTEATRAASSPQDFTADQARVLLDQIAELFPTIGSPTSGQLAGALSLAWQAGYAAAGEHPVCDWCNEPVVAKLAPELGRALWAHRDTGLYGCENRPAGGYYAQVSGSARP